MLIFYLFDIKQRHDNIHGISARHKSDQNAFDNLSKEFTSTDFLTTAGKHTSFDALERNASLGETYAMIPRFGPQFAFLTIAIDDVNNPHVFHLTFNQPYNINFPSTASDDFLSAMENGTPFASGTIKIPTNWSTLAAAVTNNHVASAFIYKRLIYNIVTILIGLKPSRLSSIGGEQKVSPRFTTDSLNDEGGIIVGHVKGFNGVHEASRRGLLHAQLMIWADIYAALLQGVADMKELCDVVADTLDSMFYATLTRGYHVKYLIEKELPFYSTKLMPFKIVS